MSYIKSLVKHLEEKNRTLFNKLELIKLSAKSVMTYSVSKFPYHTPHNFLHSQNVEEILNWLIPDEIKPKMGDYEIFFLIIAAWLHDWGMVGAKDEDAELIREIHHIRTEDNFENLYDKVHLSLQEARIVGRICRGHRKEDLFTPQYDNVYLGSNINIRVRFLAALLRVADECDTTANRTPEIIYYSIKPEGASNEEFIKHLSISGIGKPNPYKLVLSGVAKTPRGVQVIEGVKNQIQSQLNSVKTVLGNNGIMLDTVDIQIDTRGFINKPIEFHLDTSAIVKLLIGKELYSRKDAAVRELLSNAIDICRLQKVIDNNFNPIITIEINNDYVSFEDNGIGMSFEDAFNYFSKKGHSFYVSKDIQDLLKDREFDPISKFGVGLLSSFIIGDKMVVDTKKAGCTPCRFTISNLGEGWVYEEGSKRELGTKITLFLNNEGKKIDIETALRHYVKNIEIPIFIKNNISCEERKFIPTWTYDIPEVLEKISKDEREAVSKIVPELTLQSVVSGLEVTYHIFKERFLRSDKNCFLLNKGIYVGDFNFFPSISPSWIALINCKSNLIDLIVSRDDIIKNEKYSKFLNILFDNIINTVISHFCTIDSPDLNLSNCESVSHLLNSLFIDSFGIQQESIETLWLLKYYYNVPFPVLNKNGLAFLTLENIMSKGISKIIHYKIPLYFCAEHIEMAKKMFFPKMDEKEVVVFDLGPHFLSIENDTRMFKCAFCEILSTNGISSVECTNFPEKLSTYEFTQEHTPIDNLLYKGSFFTKMPEQFKGLTIQLKQFEFKPPIDKTSSATYRFYYSNNVAFQLFHDYPNIKRHYGIVSSRDNEDRELVSLGNFAYDITDPLLSFIISKADYILFNDSVKNLVQTYLQLLAIHSLSRIDVALFSSARGRQFITTNLNLTLLEKTIAEILEYPKKYMPLDQRVSRLARIFFIYV